jgi:asparagine synthase (glutamine-hydrolysing)
MGSIYGIAGEADLDEVRRLGARLHHRGGDARAWSLSPVVHLGMRGSPGAARAMEDGVIVFDGALDNRDDVARFLRRPAGFMITPHDDALLVLELFASFGADGLEQLAGQFAFALWDGPNRQLVLGRDRVGYAPLYFALDRGRLVFASEYKALLAIDGLPARANPDAIQAIHATKWVMPGATCLADVYPVAPGSVLVVRPDRVSSARYWNLPIRVTHRDEARHTEALRGAFLDTMRRQTEPYDRIGVSLSGGLDSAVMAAGVRHVAPGKELHTFTGGYGPDDRELMNAAIVAETLGSEHHPLILEPEDLPGLLPSMVWHLEEPIGREDIVYLYVAAREAAKHVEVMLTGFGFDGLFAGLPRHRVADLAIRLPPFRQALGEFYDYNFRSVEPVSPLGRALRAAYFRGSDFPAPQVNGAGPLPPFRGFPGGEEPLSNFLRSGFMMRPYQSPVERLYAGCGLRMNAHHTDPSFLATSFAIPDRLKIHGRTQKYILRKACAGLLPPAVLRFGKSFNRLRHDLRLSQVLDELADDLLDPAVVAARGLFDPAYVASLRRRAPNKPYNQARVYRLWSLLLTEIWSRIFLDRRGAAPGAPERDADYDASAVAVGAAPGR